MDNQDFDKDLESLAVPRVANDAHKRYLRQALLSSDYFKKAQPRKIAFPVSLFTMRKLSVMAVVILLVAGLFVYSYKYSNTAQAKQILDQAIQKVQNMSPEERHTVEYKINADLKEALSDTQNGRDLKYLGYQDVSANSALAEYRVLKILQYVNSKGQTVILGISQDNLPVYKKIVAGGTQIQNLFTSADTSFDQARIYVTYNNQELGIAFSYPVWLGDFSLDIKPASEGNLCADAKGTAYLGHFSNDKTVGLWAISPDYAPCASNPPVFDIKSVEGSLSNYKTFTVEDFSGQRQELPITNSTPTRTPGLAFYQYENFTGSTLPNVYPPVMIPVNNGSLKFLAFYATGYSENIKSHWASLKPSLKPEVQVALALAEMAGSVEAKGAKIVLPPGKEADANLADYVSRDYGFSFQYPKSFDQFVAGDSMYSVWDHFGQPNSNHVVVGVAIPRGSYMGTNFSVGYAVMSVSDPGISEAACHTFSDGDARKEMKADRIINGVPFYAGETGGAAAGTFTQEWVYHAYHSDRCYEISLALWSTNIGNYEPGTVKEVNYDEVWKRLEVALDTFKFAE